MALASFALRLSIVMALRGKTLAEARVYDSAIETLDQLVKGEASPLIIVSADEADSEAVKPASLLSGVGQLKILIETAVARAVQIPGEDAQGAETVLSIGPTDQGLEFTLDVLERQIARVLETPDTTPWSDLWRRFAMTIPVVEKKRGGSGEAGVRFASRFIILTIVPIDDPPVGAMAAGPWADLIAALRAEPETEMQGIGNVLAQEIEAPEGLADWRKMQALLGIAEESVRGLGIAPPYTGTPEPPPAIESYEAMDGPIDAERADEIAGPADAG